MREINYKLHERLTAWGAYEYKFKNNLLGWPEESVVYKFWKEGLGGGKSYPKKSRVPFDYPEEVNRVNKVFNELKAHKPECAEAFYLYYVEHVNVKEYAGTLNIHHSTFYKRINEAYDWFIDKISLL